jgi:hypothetical protein
MKLKNTSIAHVIKKRLGVRIPIALGNYNAMLGYY